jgi:hypothetical protein
MEYNLISYEQLLNLVLQLPKPTQKRLITAIKRQHETLPKIQTKTVEQINGKNYQYPNKQPQKIVGIWENEVEMDKLIPLL